MKKLYYYDEIKNIIFKISFDSESARYSTLKAMVPKTAEDILPSEIKIQKTFPIKIYGKKEIFCI